MSYFCNNCGYSILFCTKNGCAIIREKTASHTWEEQKSALKFPIFTQCKICGIYGHKYSKNANFTCYDALRDELYSCNEYLMIKANE